MSETDNSPESPRGIDRRSFLRTVGVTAGAGAVGVSGVGPSVTQEGDALGPIGVGIAVVGAGVAGWTLRETGIIGSDSDPPPDGLGPVALHKEVFRTLRTRRGTLKSTITDNINLIEASRDTAFSQAKLKAIEAINAEKTKSEVQSDAETAVNDYYDTIQTNLQKSFAEAIDELSTTLSLVESNSNLSYDSVVTGYQTVGENNPTSGNTSPSLVQRQTYTLNGSQHESLQFRVSIQQGDGLLSVDTTFRGDKVTTSAFEDPGDFRARLIIESPDGERFDYLAGGDGTSQTFSDSEGVHITEALNRVSTARNDTLNDIALWVDTVYDQVQAGTISTGELLGPAEIATQLSNDESNATAVGDLLALNVPGSYGESVTVEYTVDEPNLGKTTATGTLANSEGATVSEGDTIDPANTPGDWYLSAKVDTLQTEWTAFNSSRGIDGGILEFTSDPVDVGIEALNSEIIFSVTTTDGETVSVSPNEFVKKDQDVPVVWQADLSGKLSKVITDIEQILVFVAGESGSGGGLDTESYQTIRLTTPFTVISTPNGEDVSFTDTPREPQTDTNYTTQQEWEDLESSIQDQIDSYEEAKSTPIIGGGDLLGDLPTFPGLSAIETIVVVLGGGWLLGQLGNS